MRSHAAIQHISGHEGLVVAVRATATIGQYAQPTGGGEKTSDTDVLGEARGYTNTGGVQGIETNHVQLAGGTPQSNRQTERSRQEKHCTEPQKNTAHHARA